jgi:DNA-binding MarR family transcriptional regulator
MARITKAEYESLAAFRYALRQFLRYSENAARAAGLTPHQHQALLAIRGFPGRHDVTVGELAERLQIQHHSAVELVDRLVAEGLVARRTSSLDRRRVRVSLTPRGIRSLEKLSLSHREELKRLGPNLRRLLQRLHIDES